MFWNSYSRFLIPETYLKKETQNTSSGMYLNVGDYVFLNVFKCDVLHITKCHHSQPHNQNQDDVVALFNLIKGSKMKLVSWEEGHGRDPCGSTLSKERGGKAIDVNAVGDS